MKNRMLRIEFCQYCDFGADGNDSCGRNKSGIHYKRGWCRESQIIVVEVRTTREYIKVNEEEIPRTDIRRLASAIEGIVGTKEFRTARINPFRATLAEAER